MSSLQSRFPWKYVFGLGTLGALGYSAVEIASMDKSKSHTWTSMLHQYLIFKVLNVAGRIQYTKFNDATTRAAEESESTLLSILRENALTEFGRKHGFGDIKNRSQFRAVVPLSQPSDLEPDLVRIIAGEPNVRTSEPVTMIGVTKGTEGPPRKVPCIQSQFEDFFEMGILPTYYALQKETDASIQLKKTCKLMFPVELSPVGPGSLPMGANHSSPENTKYIDTLYSTPKAVYEGSSREAVMFYHALFALKDKHLGVLEANYSSTVLEFFQFLENHWEQLVATIETGELPETMDAPEEVKGLLEPDSYRAEALRRIFQRHDAFLKAREEGKPFARTEGWGMVSSDYAGDESKLTLPTTSERPLLHDRDPGTGENTFYSERYPRLAPALWPHLSSIIAVNSGPYAQYGHKLREKFLAGKNVNPIFSPLYACTEGLVGLNFTRDISYTEKAGPLDSEAGEPGVDDEESYILHPQSLFIELIPLSHVEAESPPTVFLDEAEVGSEYEVVITNGSGLYRHRLADIVKVVGKYNEAPRVKLLGKRRHFAPSQQPEDTPVKVEQNSNTSFRVFEGALMNHLSVVYLERGSD